MTTIPRQILQRSDLIGTPVITRNTNKKLGVITQLWVDIDQREVMALELQDNLISGTSRSIQLSPLNWANNIIQVSSEDAIEDISILGYSKLINDEVITETGKVLGRVRDFKFDINSRLIHSLIIGPPGISWIPTRLVTTFEPSVEEVVGSGPDRLIVVKGAQERLNQLNIGILERLGFGRLLWKQLEEAYMEGWEEPEPEEFYDGEGYYDDEEYEDPEQPKYEYVEEEYDAWADEWSDPPEEPPASSPIGRRPWGPQSPSPLSTDTFPDLLDPPIP